MSKKSWKEQAWWIGKCQCTGTTQNRLRCKLRATIGWKSGNKTINKLWCKHHVPRVPIDA